MRSKRKLSRSETMARVRSRNTSVELLLRKELWARGLRYRIHYNLPGTPDVVFVRRRVAVFVDGCFWHGCPEHYTLPATNRRFWADKVARNIDRDRRVDAQLHKLGWTVMRFWSHEIEGDLAAVAHEIIAQLEK